jgi:hypothetical protein
MSPSIAIDDQMAIDLLLEPEPQRWAIYLIRERGVFVGSVEAANEQSAITTAVQKFAIAPDQQKRLIARRAGK